jgi:hypothetical protein
MLTGIISSLAGALIFLFLFWRKLKEDYFPSLIFSTAFYMLLGIAVGILLSKLFFPPLWFWSTFVGISCGVSLGIIRFRLRTYETIEAAAISILPWVTLVFLTDAAKTSSLSSFIAGVGCVLLIVLYKFVYSRYKNFSWYASGRVGFSGLVTLAVFFLARACLALFFPSVLSFVKVETLISASVAFGLMLAIFNLARKKI